MTNECQAMRYPVGQSQKELPLELARFTEFGSQIHYDFEHHRYSLTSIGSGQVYHYSEYDLKQIHPRLALCIRKAHAVMHHDKTAFAVTRQNVRCWYLAVVLDASFPSAGRYYFDIISELSYFPEKPDHIRIKGKNFSTEISPQEAFRNNVSREDVHVVIYANSIIAVEKNALEKVWPGVNQHLLLCEELGVSAEDAAKYFLYHHGKPSFESQVLPLEVDLTTAANLSLG